MQQHLSLVQKCQSENIYGKITNAATAMKAIKAKIK